MDTTQDDRINSSQMHGMGNPVNSSAFNQENWKKHGSIPRQDYPYQEQGIEDRKYQIFAQMQIDQQVLLKTKFAKETMDQGILVSLENLEEEISNVKERQDEESKRKFTLARVMMQMQLVAFYNVVAGTKNLSGVHEKIKKYLQDWIAKKQYRGQILGKAPTDLHWADKEMVIAITSLFRILENPNAPPPTLPQLPQFTASPSESKKVKKSEDEKLVVLSMSKADQIEHRVKENPEQVQHELQKDWNRDYRNLQKKQTGNYIGRDNTQSTQSKSQKTKQDDAEIDLT